MFFCLIAGCHYGCSNHCVVDCCMKTPLARNREGLVALAGSETLIGKFKWLKENILVLQHEATVVSKHLIAGVVAVSDSVMEPLL